MRIEWVNHASFVMEHGDVRLIVDPWFDGTAFDDGWSLLSPTQFRPEDFASITHIWLSHEHPDHFSPATLRSIPADVRSRIIVMFQRTRDRRVVDFLDALGFADVRELPSREWVDLDDDVEVMCVPWRYDDSWLAVRTPDQLLLDINDCLVGDADDMTEIRGLIGDRPTILATQFSYASWVGNPADTAAHEQAAQEALDAVAGQVAALQPTYLIPFASYVWFCHEENAFMNAAMNTAADIVERVADLDVDPVVMYPGDTWDVGAPPPTDAAIARYDRDRADLVDRPLHSSDPVPLHELVERGGRFRAKVLEHHGVTLRAMSLVRLPAPTHIWLSDHEHAVQLSMHRGITRSRRGPDDADVAMTSAALGYMLANLWGGMTVIVAGRFCRPAGGDFERFRKYVHLADWTNHGATVLTAGMQRVASYVPFGATILQPFVGE